MKEKWRNTETHNDRNQISNYADIPGKQTNMQICKRTDSESEKMREIARKRKR